MITLHSKIAIGFPLMLAALAGSACGSSTTDNGPAVSADSGTAPVADAMVVSPDAGDDAGEDSGPGIVAIPLSSCTPSEYTAPATIGTQTFQLTLDTGSTTVGVASSSCTSCSEAKPLYKPGSTAKDEKKTQESLYGSGSWQGEVYQDSVALGGSPDVPIKFVAIDQQQNFFEPIRCDSKSGGFQGIMGFGPASSALPGTSAFFDAYVAKEKVPNIFALELCETSGTLWLGGYDPSFALGALQYVPLLEDEIGSHYYAVSLDSISANGMDAPIGTSDFPDTVLDSGTSIVILPTAAFNTITTAIAASPKFTEIFGAGTDSSWFANPSNCTQLTQTKAELDAALPPLTLKFGDVSVQAAATESYLISYEGLWCPALDAMDPSFDSFPLASIMGSPILRSNLWVFDRGGKRVGVAPHTACM